MSALIELRKVRKQFTGPERQPIVVLDGVNFALRENEIVALLGKSGSGKSTLLRIIAGLTPPTAGEVLYNEKPIRGSAPGLRLVFQTFALLPWLDVFQNVPLGPAAPPLDPPAQRRRPLVRAEVGEQPQLGARPLAHQRRQELEPARADRHVPGSPVVRVLGAVDERPLDELVEQPARRRHRPDDA